MTLRRLGRASSPGFTLIELLVVIAIIGLLLSLIGVVAVKARAKARSTKCKDIIKRIHVAMDTYKAFWSMYPSGAPDDPTISVWPSPYVYSGEDLDRRFLTDRDPGSVADFKRDDYDPADDKYFLDPWGKRIRYRKPSHERILIWSTGPDGIDQIGLNKFERAGDDISQVDVSF